MRMALHNRAAWIGVDLDGTLAHYEGWKGADGIGAPVPAMVDRVIRWVEEGREVRIMTARVSPKNLDREENIKAINKWLHKHVYPRCPVWFREPIQIEFVLTHEKDLSMIELWDDRCVQIVPNTGARVDGKDKTRDVQAELAEASKRYRVRNVRTGRYLVCRDRVQERTEVHGFVIFRWIGGISSSAVCDWVREDALAIAKMWIAVSGDMDVEIEEVKP